MTDFKPGDKIRITHEITVDRMGETCSEAAYAREGGLYMWNRSHSTVELIEPADDPSKDPVGTVRMSAPATRLGVRQKRSVFVKMLDGLWYHADRLISECPPYESADLLTGTEVIGAVPGTPAAEAELWTGNGSEEPPAYVTKLRDEHGDVLVRSGRNWRWVSGPGVDAGSAREFEWDDDPSNEGLLTEVRD